MILKELKIHPNLIKISKKNSKKGYFLSWCPISWKTVWTLNDLPHFPQRMKIENVEKLLASLNDKKMCYTNKEFKTSTRLWISIEKKSYIDMNTGLKIFKKWFQKDFFKLMNEMNNIIDE